MPSKRGLRYDVVWLYSACTSSTANRTGYLCDVQYSPNRRVKVERDVRLLFMQLFQDRFENYGRGGRIRRCGRLSEQEQRRSHWDGYVAELEWLGKFQGGERSLVDLDEAREHFLSEVWLQVCACSGVVDMARRGIDEIDRY